MFLGNKEWKRNRTTKVDSIMLSKKEYNDLKKLLQRSDMVEKKKIHIIGELKLITKFKKKNVVY